MYLYSVVVMVAAVVLMNFGAQWMVQLISGSSEPIVRENGARYLLWNAPFYAVLGVLLLSLIHIYGEYTGCERLFHSRHRRGAGGQGVWRPVPPGKERGY